MGYQKIEAIAFDLDHTLYDRYGTLRSIAFLLKQRYTGRLNPSLHAAQLGDMLVEADKAHIYDGWPIMFESLLARDMFLYPPSFEEYFAFFMEAFQKIAVPFPMMEEMLAGLRRQGYRLGLLTNGESQIQRGKVKLIGLENSFDRILAGEEMEIQKPAPQPFIEMARCLGCAPERMAYVGDNPLNDAVAAGTAGCIPIWVRTSGKEWPLTEYEPPLYEIFDVLELPALLKTAESEFYN